MEKVANVLLPMDDIIHKIPPVPPEDEGTTQVAPSCTEIQMQEINAEPITPVALATTMKGKAEVVASSEVLLRVNAKEDIDTSMF